MIRLASSTNPLSPEEEVALIAVVEALTAPSRVVAAATPDVTPAWRFSGRSFGPGRRRAR